MMFPPSVRHTIPENQIPNRSKVIAIIPQLEFHFGIPVMERVRLMLHV